MHPSLITGIKLSKEGVVVKWVDYVDKLVGNVVPSKDHNGNHTVIDNRYLDAVKEVFSEVLPKKYKLDFVAKAISEAASTRRSGILDLTK